MANSNLAQITYENYYQMLSDTVRMDAYKKAIFNTVKPGDVVIDMGAGTGLLSIWAVQAGARKVYAIEKTNAIALAKEIVKANQCEDKIELINKNSMDVVLPEQADVLISETLGSFGIDENTLQFTYDVRKRLLHTNGKMIPQSIELFVSPVNNAEVYNKIDFWRHISDVDFSPAFDVFSKKIMIENIAEQNLLSVPVKVASIDLMHEDTQTFSAREYIKIEKQGVIHGVAGWFKCKLCDGVEIDTSPGKEKTHWKQAFFPFSEKIEVIPGDVLDWNMALGVKDVNSDDTQISYEYRCTQLKNEKKHIRNLNPGRNDVCPCGSGKKYKKCCLM